MTKPTTYKSKMESPIVKSIIICLLLFFGYTVLLSIFVVQAIAGLEEFSDIAMLILQFIFFETIPVVIYFLIYKRKIDVVSALSLRKVSLKNLGYILVLQILITPLVNLANYVSFMFGSNETIEYLTTMGMSFFQMFILVDIIGPILEEVIFRGIVFDITKGRSVKFMALVSGLSFALFHMDINQFSYAIILGALFTVFVAYTGSIFSAIFAHFLVNGSSTVLLFLSNRLMEQGIDILGSSEEFVFEWNVFLPYLAFAIFTSTLFAFVFRRFKKYNKENNIYYKINCKQEEVVQDVIEEVN